MEDYIKDTLDWCNLKRIDKGLAPLDDLPKGSRMDGASCPCGAATGLFVGRTQYGEPNDGPDGGILFHSYLPESVRRFVRRFDSGQLPQYDDDPLVVVPDDL